MKTVPNVSFSLKVDDNSNHSTTSLLTACLNNAPAGGFDLATMRARNRVADALEKIKPGAELKLEDADYTAAQEAVKLMKWGARHKDIAKFCELFGV